MQYKYIYTIGCLFSGVCVGGCVCKADMSYMAVYVTGVRAPKNLPQLQKKERLHITNDKAVYCAKLTWAISNPPETDQSASLHVSPPSHLQSN